MGTQFYRGFVVILTDLILRSKYLMGLVITPHGSSGYDFLRVVRSTKAKRFPELSVSLSKGRSKH
ncbi:hypothetical protein [Leptospira noguchii]|uniref:hypothetical protein n=1 Tax=Leptospira noguchii TaxID=28182 RepID=UPI001FB6BFDC|nr:hypothetical protein [Leptospira noguchii]UOG60969.1 hypothetical protein MAL07_02515 [Leptospira noguchii]